MKRSPLQDTSPAEGIGKTGINIRMSPLRRLWLRARYRVANAFVRTIFNRPMYISANPKGLVVGMVVFWYMENGQRKFLMFRESRKGAQARFVGSLDAFADQNLQDGLMRSIDSTLGEAFVRTLEGDQLAADRIAAAPRLTLEDDITGKLLPVQALCWQVQIRPEQAQLCVPRKPGLEVLAVPEFGILGPDVAAPHKTVYQNVLRHIEKQSAPTEGFGLSQLDNLLANRTTVSRILH